MKHLRQIILDTETTGFYYDRDDRLIEFAGLEMIDRRLTGNYLHLYVHPERDIPEEAAKVHGITLDQLEGKPKFAEIGQQIADFIAGAELVIHNAPFDVGFLNAEFRRTGLPSVEELTANVVDTLVMARAMYPGQKNSLDALCTRLEVDRSKRVFHGALIDCELLSEVYLGMTRSQFSLADQFAEEESAEADAPAMVIVPTERPAQLKVLAANAEENAAHEAYLDELDKKAEGGSIWRKTP